MPENPKSIVTTGFSNIHVALYADDGGNVTYTGVRKLGRSVSMSTDISTSDDNNFYADDRLAETETGSAFTDGSGTMTIDGLTPDDEAFLMGLKAGNPVQVDGSNSVETLEYGAEMEPPYIGGTTARRTAGRSSRRPCSRPKARQWPLSKKLWEANNR